MLPLPLTQYCIRPCPVPVEKVKAQVSLGVCPVAPDREEFDWAKAREVNISTARNVIDCFFILRLRLLRGELVVVIGGGRLNRRHKPSHSLARVGHHGCQMFVKALTPNVTSKPGESAIEPAAGL